MQKIIKKVHKINLDEAFLKEIVREKTPPVSINSLTGLRDLKGDVFFDGMSFYFESNEDYAKFLLKSGTGVKNDKEN